MNPTKPSTATAHSLLPRLAGMKVTSDSAWLIEKDGPGLIERDGPEKVVSDGAGLIERDGPEKVVSDGAGLIERDGPGKVVSDGAGLIERDGPGRVVSDSAGLIERDGPGKVVSDGAGLIESDGAHSSIRSFMSISLNNVNKEDVLPLTMEQLGLEFPHLEKMLHQPEQKEHSSSAYNVDAETIAKQLLTHDSLAALDDYIRIAESHGDEARELSHGTRIFFSARMPRLLTSLPGSFQRINFIEYVWPGLHRNDSRIVHKPGIEPLPSDMTGNHLVEVSQIARHWQLVFSSCYQVDSEQAMNVFQNIFRSAGMLAVKRLMPGPEQLGDNLLEFSSQFPVAFALMKTVEDEDLSDWWMEYSATPHKQGSHPMKEKIRDIANNFQLQPLTFAIKKRLRQRWGVNIDEERLDFLANGFLYTLYLQRDFLYQLTKPFNPLALSDEKMGHDAAFKRQLQTEQRLVSTHQNIRFLLKRLNTLAESGQPELAANTVMSLQEMPLLILPVAKLVSEVTATNESPDYIFQWLESIPGKNNSGENLYTEVALKEWSFIHLKVQLMQAEPTTGEIRHELSELSRKLKDLLGMQDADQLSRQYCTALNNRGIDSQWGVVQKEGGTVRPYYHSARSAEEASLLLTPILRPGMGK